MKLYLIKYDDVGYDEYLGFVIRAESKKQALQIADTIVDSNQAGNVLSCEEIETEGEAGVILDSYKAV